MKSRWCLWSRPATDKHLLKRSAHTAVTHATDGSSLFHARRLARGRHVWQAGCQKCFQVSSSRCCCCSKPSSPGACRIHSEICGRLANRQDPAKTQPTVTEHNVSLGPEMKTGELPARLVQNACAQTIKSFSFIFFPP